MKVGGFEKTDRIINAALMFECGVYFIFDRFWLFLLGHELIQGFHGFH